MDKNYNIIGPKLAVTRVTNTRKMMLVIDTGTLGIKLDLNFRKNNFHNPCFTFRCCLCPRNAGCRVVSVKCALFSPGSSTFFFSVNIILVQNDSGTKCFQNVTCFRSYHLTPSFDNQNKKKMLTCLCFQVLSFVQRLDPRGACWLISKLI